MSVREQQSLTVSYWHTDQVKSWILLASAVGHLNQVVPHRHI